MIRALAVAVVALAACHDLPDLGVCGNGVIEAELGEACDGGPRCTATCELACASDGTCAEGQTCAIDGICRAPSGEFFAIGGARLFDIKAARTGDFDGDRVDDLVGVSGTAIAVRYGSTTGTPFIDGFEQPIAISQGTAAIFDRDPTSATAGTSDLAIALATDGLALLSSDTSTFHPAVDGAISIPIDAKARIVVEDPGTLGEVLVEVERPSAPGPIRISRSELVEDTGRVVVPREVFAQPCGASLQLIDVAVGRGRRSFVVVGRTGNPNVFVVCTYTGFTQTAEVAVAGAPPTSIALANLDADPCEELAITHATGDTTTVEMIDTSGATCTPANTTTSVGTVDAADAVLLASGSIEPTTARDELVLSSGVYVLGAGGLTRFAAPSLNPWTVAVVIDLDRDGHADVVAGHRGEDADVVRGGREPDNRFTADTTKQVTSAVAGDFDGDGFGDVALVEGNGTAAQVSLLYGGAGGILGPARANSAPGGDFTIAAIRRFTWGGTPRGSDAIDDLLVLRATAGVPRHTVGVLFGEPTRLLTMPRFPAVQVPSLGALAVGSFDGATVTAAAIRPVGPGNSELTTLALDDMSAGFATTPITGVEVIASRPPQLVRATGGTVMALFATEAGSPVVRAIDAAGTVCAGSPTAEGQVHGADLDGDGDEELVVNDNRVRRTVRAFALAGGAACAIGDELLVDALADCAEVTRVGDTVVAACIADNRTELYRIVDGVRELEPFARGDGLVSQLFVGDYTGDGVPDLAVTVARSGVVSVLVFGQCPAHDRRLCRPSI